MHTLKLKVITPKKVVLEETVVSVTLPTIDGEITVLPRHTNIFSVLAEGIVKIKKQDREDYLAIGGGYLETDGEEISILVSRAYRQDEINRELTENAIKQAQKVLQASKDHKEKVEAERVLRRSLIEIKLLKKRRRRKGSRPQNI